MQHCILASCRITKDDEDCQEESPPKYLGYPPCISKDIETFCWCKQPMGEEETYTSRMEEYSHSYIEPLMSTHDAKRGCRRQTFSSYKLQLLTVLNNAINCNSLTRWTLELNIWEAYRRGSGCLASCHILGVASGLWIQLCFSVFFFG